MSRTTTIVFVPGSWHQSICYDKVIQLLRNKNGLECVAVSLPSTKGDPNATFKEDIDAVRDAIASATTHGDNVIVVAHSYGGMVGNSAIKGLTKPKSSNNQSSEDTGITPTAQHTASGHVIGLLLIASGFTFTGLAFMDPFLGKPPPSWRINSETGFAELVVEPREFFYHDLPEDEGTYWVSQLTSHSLKSLFEGGEYAYAGWQDVPTWYIGTLEDRGLPVVMQRVAVGLARGQGGVVYHTELKSSHSPFLSMPKEVANIIWEAVETVNGTQKHGAGSQSIGNSKAGHVVIPAARFTAPLTWLRFGIPLLIGRFLGWGVSGFLSLRRLWNRRTATSSTP